MEKFITKFATTSGYQEFLNSGECPYNNVSYIEETNKNEYVVYQAPAAAKIPFYIEFTNGFDPTGGDYPFWFDVRKQNDAGAEHYGAWGTQATWSYKVDNGSWNDLTFTEVNSSQSFQLSSLNGVTSSTNKIYWRLKVAPKGGEWTDQNYQLASTKFMFNFEAGDVKIGGNLASLCTTREDFYNVPAVDYQYYNYFSEGQNSHQYNTDFSDVCIDVPVLSKAIYRNMFYNIQNVVPPTINYTGPAA